jgi:ubiquinone/menaquinone biosynthesis C-methylase UbiE
MPTEVRSNRISLISVWAVTGLFVLGFIYNPIGMWTGPVLGVWFVSTQRVRRGFMWLLALIFIPSLVMHWRQIATTGAEQTLKFLALLFLAAVVAAVPFTFHRIVSPRLPGLLATFPFPIAAAVTAVFITPLLADAGESRMGFGRLFILWFAALLIWLWNRESKATPWVAGMALSAGAGIVILERLTAFTQVLGVTIGWSCVGGALLLTICAAVLGVKTRRWRERAETVELLQSPVTGDRLTLTEEGGHEFLATVSGERFPIEDGIPNFLRAEDLTGDNGKYNHLYETIGGFYDDTQRVACALRGLDRDSYFLNYMGLLEVAPGDSVLETSVGTGLNFRYLPRGVKLSGLDLSREMLSSCRRNLQRSGMNADLYLGNAESLPFADSSFDVVFHVGGISFFNDQKKAIQEMIRVAKPGSLLLIEDETEEYAKGTYEKIPITSGYFKNRARAISVPIDLIPPEMEEIKLDMLKDGKFFAITFRKPLPLSSHAQHSGAPGWSQTDRDPLHIAIESGS